MPAKSLTFDFIVNAISIIFNYFDETSAKGKFQPSGHYMVSKLCVEEKIWDALEEELTMLNKHGIKMFTATNANRLYGFEVSNPQMLSLIRKHFTTE